MGRGDSLNPICFRCVHLLSPVTFHLTFCSFQPIDPTASKVEILSTKIELSLKKSNGISWVSIEPNTEVTSWTTFGTTGMVGTVGGKEAVIAGDAPISLLKK
jgi:hypothetical protein